MNQPPVPGVIGRAPRWLLIAGVSLLIFVLLIISISTDAWLHCCLTPQTNATTFYKYNQGLNSNKYCFDATCRPATVAPVTKPNPFGNYTFLNSTTAPGQCYITQQGGWDNKQNADPAIGHSFGGEKFGLVLDIILNALLVICGAGHALRLTNRLNIGSGKLLVIGGALTIIIVVFEIVILGTYSAYTGSDIYGVCYQNQHSFGYSYILVIVSLILNVGIGGVLVWLFFKPEEPEYYEIQ